MRRMFQFTLDEMLLGALVRTLAQIVGKGVVAVDLMGDGRSVLKPDVDPRRTIGGFALRTRCAWTASAASTPIDPGAGRRASKTAVGPASRIGYGLLRYLHAPTSRLLGAVASPEIFLSNEGMIPDLPSAGGPVEVDVDTSMPVRDKMPGLGHAIELRVYRSTGGLHVDWWYDSRRIQRAKVEALAERFPGCTHRIGQGSDGHRTRGRRSRLVLRGTRARRPVRGVSS